MNSTLCFQKDSSRLGKRFAVSLALGAISVAGFTNVSAASAKSLNEGVIINPVYQQYLQDKNAGLGDNWVLIPNQYITPANVEAGRGGVDLPSSYNLVTSGYATTQKNQGGDGACWAYATTTAMESYMKKKKGTTIEFAPKQLDYVMSPLTKYGRFLKSKYNIDRGVGDGGNFLIANLGTRSDYVVDRENDFYSRMKANDSTLANFDTFNKYNDFSVMFDFDKYNKTMSEAQILGNKAEYVVDGFEHYSRMDADVIAKIKQKVYMDGAVYVGTYAPETEGCWDAATETVIDKGTVCDSRSGHAMAIVGWDDNYTYNDGTRGAKRGAFILQNSHGKSTMFSDNGITAEKYMDLLRETGALNGKTDAEIQTIATQVADMINNLNRHEFVHLGYDFETSASSGTIDFAAISGISKNDYQNVYDMTKATVTAKDGKLLFRMSGDGDQDVTAVGVDLLAAQNTEMKMKVSVDIDNDGVGEYFQNINYGPMDAGRRTVNLDSPAPVSGDFTIIVESEGFELIAGNDNTISVMAYTKPASDYVLVPDTSGVGAPNTGNYIESSDNTKFNGVMATLGIVVVALSVGTILKNRKYIHKVKFDKK